MGPNTNISTSCSGIESDVCLALCCNVAMVGFPGNMDGFGGPLISSLHRGTAKTK